MEKIPALGFASDYLCSLVVLEKGYFDDVSEMLIIGAILEKIPDFALLSPCWGGYEKSYVWVLLEKRPISADFVSVYLGVLLENNPTVGVVSL